MPKLRDSIQTLITVNFRFIAKQGLDKTFYECDMHMWRIGDRVLPWGIRVDGGSDWIALHRDFCAYVTQQNNTLLQGLMTVFKYTLLPAEVSIWICRTSCLFIG